MSAYHSTNSVHAISVGGHGSSIAAGSLAICLMAYSPITDTDGDLIVISSDEELVEALDQFDGNVFRLYLKKSKKKLILYFL